MGLIPFIVVVIILLALAIYGISLMPNLPAPFPAILQVLAILVAILVIANRAGLF